MSEQICLGSGNAAGAYIANIINRMEPGQVVRLHYPVVAEAFPSNPFTGRSIIDALLESCIGANYGSVRAELDVLDPGVIIVSRHEIGDKRVRQDHDRRHIPLPQ